MKIDDEILQQKVDDKIGTVLNELVDNSPLL